MKKLILAFFSVLFLNACSNLAAIDSNLSKQTFPADSPVKQAKFSSHDTLVSQIDCLSYYQQKYKPPHENQAATQAAGFFWRYESEFAKNMHELDCFRFVYQVGKVMVEGFITKPKHAANATLPTIIFNRGGNPAFGTINNKMLQDHFFYLSKKGFIVIASQYRGAKVWPKENQFDVGKDEFGGEDVKDVNALIPIIEQIPEAAPQRIGMLGFSRGGMMTWLASKDNPKIKTIAVWAGVTDQFTEISFRPEFDAKAFPRWIPDYANNKEKALRDRSVLYWLDKIAVDTPILLLHGDGDKSVAVSNSIRLADRLKQRGQQHKLIIYPNGDHGLTQYIEEVKTEITNWFATYLHESRLLTTSAVATERH